MHKVTDVSANNESSDNINRLTETNKHISAQIQGLDRHYSIHEEIRARLQVAQELPISAYKNRITFAHSKPLTRIKAVAAQDNDLALTHVFVENFIFLAKEKCKHLATFERRFLRKMFVQQKQNGQFRRQYNDEIYVPKFRFNRLRWMGLLVRMGENH